MKFSFLIENKKEFQRPLKIVDEIDKTAVQIEFHFIMENELDLEESENAISENNIARFFFKPYFNGKNLKFFKQHVFTKKSDFTAIRANQREVFAKSMINLSFFGKLNIFSTGDIYANFFNSPLGNINQHSLHETVVKELHNGKSRRRLRKNILPCKKCIYNHLCPSVSSYELTLGIDNTCFLNK